MEIFVCFRILPREQDDLKPMDVSQLPWGLLKDSVTVRVCRLSMWAVRQTSFSIAECTNWGES